LLHKDPPPRELDDDAQGQRLDHPVQFVALELQTEDEYSNLDERREHELQAHAKLLLVVYGQFECLGFVALHEE